MQIESSVRPIGGAGRPASFILAQRIRISSMKTTLRMSRGGKGNEQVGDRDRLHQVVGNLGRIHHDQPTALRSKSSFQRTRSRTHSSDPSVPPRFASPSDHAAAQGTCDSSRSARSQPPQQPCRQGFVHRWPMRSPTQHRCAQPTPPDSSLLFLPHTTDN